MRIFIILALVFGAIGYGSYHAYVAFRDARIESEAIEANKPNPLAVLSRSEPPLAHDAPRPTLTPVETVEVYLAGWVKRGKETIYFLSDGTKVSGPLVRAFDQRTGVLYLEPFLVRSALAGAVVYRPRPVRPLFQASTETAQGLKAKGAR